MFAYLEGLKPGTELDDQVKKYKKAILSHRHIGVNESCVLVVLCHPSTCTIILTLTCYSRFCNDTPYILSHHHFVL